MVTISVIYFTYYTTQDVAKCTDKIIQLQTLKSVT